MTSELGCGYFLDRRQDRKTLRVWRISKVSQPRSLDTAQARANPRQRTSRALSGSLAWPLFRVATARAKSSLVRASSCSTSVGGISLRVARRAERSGRRRKNSFQKPSGFSASSSSWSGVLDQRDARSARERSERREKGQANLEEGVVKVDDLWGKDLRLRLAGER